MRIAFQGEHGAYSEAAAIDLLGPEIERVPCRSFDAVFEAVESGECDRGLVPIENSLAGSIHRNYDLLLRHKLHIIDETQHHIDHCLIAKPGVTLDQVRVVYSHPQALAQCEDTLREMGIEPLASYDTAGSVRDLRDSGTTNEGALASRLAAQVYGMQILAEDMADFKQNYTRFLLLAREPGDPGAVTKTSIVFTLKNMPGVLYRAMAAFSLRDIDLTKIESRPFPGEGWRYRFYMDFVGGQADEVVGRALNHLAEMTEELRVLGSYPRRV